MHMHNAVYHFLRIISVLPLQCHQHPQDLARSFPGLFDLAEEGTTALQNIISIYHSCWSTHPRILESQDMMCSLFAGED